MIQTRADEEIQWTHFLDEELRRYQRTKSDDRQAKSRLMGQSKKRSALPHHFFMNRELTRCNKNKKQVLFALLEARAEYLTKSDEGHQWWNLPFFGIKKGACYPNTISNTMLARIEKSIWTPSLDKDLPPSLDDSTTSSSCGTTIMMADDNNNDMMMPQTKAPNDEEVNQAEKETAIEEAEGIGRIEIIIKPQKTITASLLPKIYAVGHITNQLNTIMMTQPQRSRSEIMPASVRHMMRFSARGGPFKDGFADEPTTVQHFAVAYSDEDAKKQHTICTLVEETKTSHEWMFYIHTTRPIRTEMVCVGLIMANIEAYPNLRGTFLADNMRYMGVKRQAYSRLQHFRFFSKEICGR